VIRRAAEIQFQSTEERGGWLTAEEILRIGEEVGLEPHFLRRAMEEIRVQERVPLPEEDRSLLGRLLGPERLQVARVLPGSRSQLESRIFARLRDREGMQAVRRLEGVSIWEPSEGWITRLKRGVRWGGHRYDLARLSQIRVAISPVEAGSCLVTVTLDLGAIRRSEGGVLLGGVGVGTLAPAIALSTGLLVAAPLGSAILLLVGAGTGAGGGWQLARHGFEKRVLRALQAAEGFLDGVTPSGPR